METTTSANNRLLELLSAFSSEPFFAELLSTLFLGGFSFGDSFFDEIAISFSWASIFSRPFECSLRFDTCSLAVAIDFGSDDFAVTGLVEKNKEIEDFPAIGAFTALKIKRTHQGNVSMY